MIVGGDFSVLNGRRRHGVAAVSATGPVAPWHPLRELGGFEATFVPAGATLYVFSYNDAGLASFTPSTRGSKRGAPIANDPSVDAAARHLPN